ncbi:hypothetical protein [Tenacibaculum agarivorans]|uniref:hypothetical protein n=1 Tax=Tenacibaculum agarivorans TaxID=1908389 RepID=UPI000A3FFD7C|nr:hypothetical protein [Tenacibaculum agarivorans]
MKKIGTLLNKEQLKSIYAGVDPNCLFPCIQYCNANELPGDKFKLFDCYDACRTQVCAS